MVSAAFRSLMHAVLTLGLAAGMVAGLPPAEVLAEPGRDPERSVPVRDVPPGSEQRWEIPADPPSAVVWPEAASAVVDLPIQGERGMRSAGSATVGGLPVRVSPAVGAESDVLSQFGRRPESAAPGQVRVQVLDRAVASRFGAPVAVRVARSDGLSAQASVRLEVDYSGFRHGFGADWAWRLGLVMVPQCGLAEVVAEDCAGWRRLSSSNDADAGVLSAEVPLDGEESSTVAVMAAAASPEAGDFTKTDLSESAAWSSGLQSGDFSYSYPLGVPPVPGGFVPSVALSYSSAAVDGQTAGKHTQPSVFGEGWSYSPGFVERTYRPCNDDTANAPYWTSMNNHGDLCWRLPNAQIMLNGKSSEIVLGDDGKWRLADDNGEKVELLTGAANNDLDGEYWKITTTDGTQYWFGAESLPNGRSGTGSTMTAPVFANHSGEPCFSTSSALASKCYKQALRWMLDYVVDRHGNEITYWYTRTANKTGLAGSSSYENYYRDVQLRRIEYGTHNTDAATVKAPARVVFEHGDRCFTTTCGTKDANNWKDTPWDLECTAAPCSNNMSPSFWTDKRVARIYTQVLKSGSYSSADEWILEHDFPSTGDGSSPVLWLESITRVGHGATDITLPKVLFWGARLQNRADYDPNGGMRSHNKWRINRVLTETGRNIEVTYAADDSGCQFGSPFPNPDQNSKRCFPQYYVNDAGDGGWSWWHKRTVTRVVESDNTNASALPVTHEYSYSLAATDTTVLWGYNAGVWGSSTGRRSWSDWRGYTNVTVRTGPTAGTRSQTEYVYFRGLHGDRVDGGTRSVTLSPYSGAWSDQQQRRGQLVNKIVYSKAGGVVQQIEQYNPWTHESGKRTLSSDWAIPGTFRSNINRVGSTQRWERRDDGTLSYRTGTEDTFDTASGRILSRYDKGNAATGDETCTRYWYADNAGKHMFAFPKREQTVTGTCADPYTIPDDLVFDQAWRYDGGDYGQAPTAGNVSRDYVWNGTGWVDKADNVVYDRYGRVTSAEDALGRRVLTEYTDNADGLNTQVKVTNPLAHTVTSTKDIYRGVPLSVTDPNGKTTTATYDALGRVLTVTKPGNTTGLPDAEYLYYVSQAYRSYVRTRTLGPNGHQINSYEIFDGMLRLRQTQVVAPDWNRAITDIQYDERGLPVKRSTFYNGDSGPGSSLVAFADADVDSQARLVYDGQGRVTDEELWSRDVYQWETKTSYGFNWTAVMPPIGGTATKQTVDDKGNMTELWQYHARDFTASSDKTRYGYNLRNELTSVTDPVGNNWAYEYNMLGWKTKAVDPDAGTSTFTHDVAGQMQTSTDGRGITLDYNYDSLGRRTSIYQGTTKLASWAYDTVAKGQMYVAHRWVDGLAYSTRILTLDDAYRPTKVRTTIPSTTANTGLSGDYDTYMTYNVNGSIATQRGPGVGGLPDETLTYTYTNHGFANTLGGTWTGGSKAYISSTQYTFDGLIAEQLLSASGKRVRLTNTYDPATRRSTKQQIDSENLTSPGAWVDKYTNEYGYDRAGNITVIAGKTNGSRDQVECFSYDYLRRLTRAFTNSSWLCGTPTRAGADPYWREWTFDTIGNRLTQTDKDPVAGDTTWTYQVGAAAGVTPHQLKKVTASGPKTDTATRSFGYDAAGNTTSATSTSGAAQTLTWDAQGHLATITEAGKTTSYVYDADGNRLIAYTPDKTILYLPDGTELEKPTSGGDPLGTRYYAGIAVRDATGLKWTISNHQGTGTTQFDAVTLEPTRRRAMPYGEDRTAQPAGWKGSKGYVSGTRDNTGYTHLGAREYDPTLGRFISIDPIMDLTDPQQWHAYSYSSSSPITFSDPTGLYETCDNEGNGTCTDELPPGEIPIPDDEHEPDGGDQGGAGGGNVVIIVVVDTDPSATSGVPCGVGSCGEVCVPGRGGCGQRMQQPAECLESDQLCQFFKNNSPIIAGFAVGVGCAVATGGVGIGACVVVGGSTAGGLAGVAKASGSGETVTVQVVFDGAIDGTAGAGGGAALSRFVATLAARYGQRGGNDSGDGGGTKIIIVDRNGNPVDRKPSGPLYGPSGEILVPRR